jgi:hypothetical protein
MPVIAAKNIIMCHLAYSDRQYYQRACEGKPERPPGNFQAWKQFILHTVLFTRRDIQMQRYGLRKDQNRLWSQKRGLRPGNDIDGFVESPPIPYSGRVDLRRRAIFYKVINTK